LRAAWAARVSASCASRASSALARAPRYLVTAANHFLTSAPSSPFLMFAVSVHGARVTAVQSGLVTGTATRQPLWPSGTQVEAPASMRPTPGLGDDFLHVFLASAWPHPTRRQDASAYHRMARRSLHPISQYGFMAKASMFSWLALRDTCMSEPGF